MNLDSLQAFLDTHFKNDRKSLSQTSCLLDQLIEYKVTLSDLQEDWGKLAPRFDELKKEFWKERKYNKWAQVGAARITLDLTNHKFRSRHKGSYRLKEREVIKKIRYLTKTSNCIKMHSSRTCLLYTSDAAEKRIV